MLLFQASKTNNKFLFNRKKSLQTEKLVSTQIMPITNKLQNKFHVMPPKIYQNKIYIVVDNDVFILDLKKYELKKISLEMQNFATISGNFSIYQDKLILYCKDNVLKIVDLNTQNITSYAHKRFFLSDGAIYNHKLYFIDISGSLVQFDLNTHTFQELFKQLDDAEEVMVDYAAPTFYKENIIFGTNNGDIVIFNLQDQTYKKIAIQCKNNFHIYRPIIIHKDKLFVSSDKQLICYNMQKESIEWQLNTSITNNINVINKYVLLISNNQLLFVNMHGKIEKTFELKNIALAPLVISNNYILILDIKGYIYLINVAQNEYILAYENLEFSENPLLCNIDNYYRLITIDKNGELSVFNIGTIQDEEN